VIKRLFRSTNDVILRPYLAAQEGAESERQLIILLSEHAAPLIKSIIMARLHSDFRNTARHPDFEDLFSEVKTKLVAYLGELKANSAAEPCKDFRSYVARIAHNACHDRLRQMYPARNRLAKQLRDFLEHHPDFDLWKGQQAGWLCGFARWKQKQSTSRLVGRLAHFYTDRESVIRAMAPDVDIRTLDLGELMSAIFNQLREPIGFDDLVSIVAEIRGVKDEPAISIDDDSNRLAQELLDSTIRIDYQLELRQELNALWNHLCRLPSKELKAYLLNAQTEAGEDLITLFLAVKVVNQTQLAGLLNMSIKDFDDLMRRLPLSNESIAAELGATRAQVYRWRYKAREGIEGYISELKLKIS
jgi:RNA polymerase sigma factor (sigma-70 family)